MQWQNEAYTISKIFESIFNHNNHELLKLFIKPELIDANTVLPSGKSLLYHSVEAGNLEICRLLIDRGAEVDFAFPVHLSTSNRGNAYYKDTSVLSVAVSTGNYELVQLLLDSGANPNGYFSNGTKGKNIQSKDIPIVIAVKNNFIDIVSLLIDTDANVHVYEDRSNGGWYADKTPFGIAIGNQLLDVVKLLIESAGADPNNDFHSNGRLFEKAVSTKNEELILYLLQEGIVAAKYLDKTTKSFSKEEYQELVTRLYNEAKALLYNNNKQVLTQFFVYLSTDKSSIISKLPEDVRNCIADYTATGSQKLNSLTFENYVKHHPIEDSNVVEGSVILGQSTCEEVN